MVDLIQKVELFLSKYKIKGNILVAFSGGYDSMCLLDIISKLAPKYNLNITAIHLNHNWRGEESKKDEQTARNFALNKGLNFYCETLSDKIKHTETAAREARYNFFKKCAEKFNSKSILTAHNANDNAETVLYRIAKGTGIIGLEGICEKRDIFYRPLLTVERKDIENYCKLNNLTPNIDSSNENTKYKRNLIRKNILPQLQKINKDVIKSINSLSEIAFSDNKIVDIYIKEIEQKIKCGNTYITKDFLKQVPEIQARLVYNIFIENNLDYSKEKIEQICKFINENKSSKSGKTCSLTTNLWIFANKEKFQIVNKVKIKPFNIKIKKEGKYTIGEKIFEIKKCQTKPAQFPSDSENIAYVDFTGLDFNFSIKTRTDGDIISPLGTKGSQKLKKYINSKEIPEFERDNLIFLTINNEVLWAIGLGISEKIKVVNEPTHVLKFYSK